MVRRMNMRMMVAALAVMVTSQWASAQGLVEYALIWPGPTMARIDARNNPADPHNGLGRVNTEFQMSASEITVAEYTEFLNSVARCDNYGLYHDRMAWGMWPDRMTGSGISRHGQDEAYTYTVDDGCDDLPMTNVSWANAARYCNWLHNGKPTDGHQTLWTTEDGSYSLIGKTGSDCVGIERNPGATWVLPSHDEWYKAAYYNKATQTYNLFATGSDSHPGMDMSDADGNNANYRGIAGDAYDYLMTVDSFPNSGSPFGTLNQNGNVSEMTEDQLELGSNCSDWEIRTKNFTPDDCDVWNGAGGGSMGFRVALLGEYHKSVTTGSDVMIGGNGGAGDVEPGGCDIVFDEVTGGGDLIVNYSDAGLGDSIEMDGQAYRHGGTWNVVFRGEKAGGATMTVQYDESADLEELGLIVKHQRTDGTWEELPVQSWDQAGNRVTFRTDSFSPFVLVSPVPEPTSLILLAGGAMGLLRRGRRG